MANFLSRKGKPPHISHHGLSGLLEIRFLATKAFAPPTPRFRESNVIGSRVPSVARNP